MKPNKTATKRMTAAIPKFRKILRLALERDVNESDTVAIVADILVEVFGYNKYSEITREYAIQGTYCDLAIQFDKTLNFLVEVKAIGVNLKSTHTRQAVNYAAQAGVPWVVLTNGIEWLIYKVACVGAVEAELLASFDLGEVNLRKNEDLDKLFLLCRRGVKQDRLDKYWARQQVVNRYMLGALMLSEPVVKTLKRELLKVKKGITIDPSEITDLLKSEVIKHEIVDSSNIVKASKRIAKAVKVPPAKVQPAEAETLAPETKVGDIYEGVIV